MCGGGQDEGADLAGLELCSEMIEKSLPLTWLRPTLFSFLNFGDEASTAEEAAAESPGVLYSLKTEEDSGYLDGPFSAKIGLVRALGTQRLV
jgi:hypothetical protein